MNKNINIQQQENPSPADTRYVSQQFRAFNNKQGGVHPAKNLHLFAYGSEQQIMGALFGDVSWGWLHVDVIWVDDACRHSGIGSALMDRAEAEAVAMGVQKSYLETADFQALEFYKKRGYQVFAQLEDQPPGHICYYLKKLRLSP